MQLNPAQKWMRARIGVWSLDPSSRGAFLTELASALDAQQVGDGVLFCPPGRWADEMRVKITKVEVAEQDGSLHFDGQRLDLEVIGCGPDSLPEPFSLDALVLAAAEDPLPALAELRACPVDLGVDPAPWAFQLRAPASFPDLPDAPRFVGPNPEPAVREAVGVLMSKLFW